MATRTTRSQTWTISAAPSIFPSTFSRYNLLNAFGSNQWGPKLVDQFQSFSTCCTMPSASQPPPSQESPTPGAHVMVIPDYDVFENLAGLLFGGPTLYDNNDARDPDFPRPQQKTSPLKTPMKNQRLSMFPWMHWSNWQVPSKASLVPLITLPLTLASALKSKSPTSLMGLIPESPRPS